MGATRAYGPFSRRSEPSSVEGGRPGFRLAFLKYEKGRSMARRVRGAGEAWLRGGQTLGHTFDMVVEVIGRLAIPAVIWAGFCISFGNARSTAAEQTYGLHRGQAWLFNELGWPFPTRLSIDGPDGVARSYANSEVLTLAWLQPYAQRYAHNLELALWLWVAGVVLLVVVATRWFLDSGESKLKARFIRGQVVAPLRDLVDQIEAFNQEEARRRRDRAFQPVRLLGVPYPYGTEREHTLTVGSPGSGKSQAVHRLIESLRARGDRAVVYDPELEYTRHHFDPRVDVILNPYDARSVGWSPYNDARDLPDFDKLAACIFKDPKSGDPYWTRATRQIFTYAAYQLRRQAPDATLEDLLMVLFGPPQVLAALVAGTPAGSHLAGGSNGRTDSLRSVLADGASSLVHLAGRSADFSIRDWVNGGDRAGGILFLSAPESHITSLRPLLSFWSELVVGALLNRVEERDRCTTWLVLDEFPSLGRVESLAAGPERLRKYGGAVVLGMQQVSQIQEIYGHEVAQTIIGQCATKLILRCQDPETAKHMAEQLGRRQARRVDETVSYGANSLRDGVGLTPREELELVALPDEVMNLPKFHGFVRVSNARTGAPFPISTIRFAFRPRAPRSPGLVLRPGPGPVEAFFDLMGQARPPTPAAVSAKAPAPDLNPAVAHDGGVVVSHLATPTEARTSAPTPTHAYDRLLAQVAEQERSLLGAAEKAASDEGPAPVFDPFAGRPS